ncbi:sugar transferase [Miltoncostaea oceani]|uniref:sugar transferase n=1 Tax=Miltoncostaea oceani TaxID=2843216 RepID=UPI001C3E0BC5|nr:sugar transferase [Miltoncostaea oceani]
MLWDIVTTAAAFSLTTRIDGLSPTPAGAVASDDTSLTGTFEPAAIAFVAFALIGLAMIRDRETGLGGRVSTMFRLGAIAGVSLWATLLTASAAGWAVDLDQFLVISLTLPVAWIVGRLLLDRPRRERVLLLGSGKVASHLTALALRHPESRFDVIGWLDDEPGEDEESAQAVIGRLDDLPRILVEGQVDRIVVCFSMASDARIAAVLRDADAYRVNVDVVPRMFDLVGPATESRLIGGLPLLSVTGGRQRISQGMAKRAFDLAAASVLVVLTLPVMALVAVAVKLDSPGPVLYRSARLGRSGTTFSMLKFRTMSVGADAAHGDHAADLLGGHLKRPDDPRVTRLGRMLRRFSLDELPQLLNILGGSMSLVGPRPVLLSEAQGIEGWASRRHNVRPGVTGLWQVLGRSTIPWHERMQLDYTYARHWSMGFDIKILASTFVAVVSRRGAF